MAKNELDARFAQFGTVSFASVTQVNDFVGYLEEGKLMGTRCKTSRRVTFPRAPNAAIALPQTWNGLKSTEMGNW